MFKTATDIVVFIGGVFVIIGGLYAAYVVIHKKWKSFASKKDTFFSGSWSNEGNIIKGRPSHYIDLTISCGGGKIYGSFNVRKCEDEEGWNKMSINGKRRFYSAKCKILHVKNGELLNYGKVILKKNKERNLSWKLVNGTADFFPKTAVLNRSLPVIA